MNIRQELAKPAKNWRKFIVNMRKIKNGRPVYGIAGLRMVERSVHGRPVYALVDRYTAKCVMST